jgi:hypothetical protein
MKTKNIIDTISLYTQAGIHMSQKEDIHSDTFKLISFNTYDYKPKNNEDSDSDDDTKKSKFAKKNEDVFQVQMFGINEKGQTASMFLGK